MNFYMAKKYKKEEVVNLVVKMRLEDMCSTKTILDYLMNDLKYGQTMAYNILKAARQQISDYYRELNTSSLEEAIGQMENLSEDAKKRKDYKLAFEIRKEMSKIQGHYKERIELSGGMDNTIKIIRLIGPENGLID